MAQLPFIPTKEQSRMVKSMVAYGIPQRDICAVLKIALDTMRKHFSEEIKTATAEANTTIAQSLFQKALNGSLRAQTFWLDRRGGEAWKPRATLEHEVSGGKFTIKLNNEDEEPNRIEYHGDSDE